MQCPLDGTLLVQAEGQDVRFDTCRMCGGVWIDSSEFERLLPAVASADRKPLPGLLHTADLRR